MNFVTVAAFAMVISEVVSDPSTRCQVSASQRRVSCGGNDVTNRTVCSQYNHCCFNKDKQPNCYTGRVTLQEIEKARNKITKVEKPNESNNSNFLTSINQLRPIGEDIDERLLVIDQSNAFETEMPTCAVNIPLCQRSPCQPNNPQSQENPIICLSDPTCCFDEKLFVYRVLYGEGFMGGSPVCYNGPISQKYLQIAQLATPWNPFYQSSIVQVFKTIKGTEQTDLCTFANMMDTPFQRSPMCGWIGISETECQLVGCCYSTKTYRCIYPSLQLMRQFLTVERFPQFITNDVTETRCSPTTTFIPKLFHRLPCLQDNNSTSNSRSLYSCPDVACCKDALALLPGAIGLQGQTQPGQVQPPPLVNVDPLELLTAHSNPGSSTLEALSAIYCPFYFFPVPGFPDLSSSAEGCCVRHACFHLKATSLYPTAETTVQHSWSTWSTWGACDVTCGTGRRQSRRSCISTSGMLLVSTDLCRGVNTQYQACTVGQCGASWATWSAWQPCAETCGGALRSRRRACVDIPSNQTLNPDRCVGPEFDMISCGELPCANWGSWGQYGACNASCNKLGVTSRQRACLTPTGTHNQSLTCIGESIEFRSCNGPQCDAWGVWGSWSACGADCVRSRSKYCGTNCGTQIPSQSEQCYIGSCTRPRPSPWVAWGGWGQWESCTATCGVGSRIRRRGCYYLGTSKWVMHHSFCGFVYGSSLVLQSQRGSCNVTCRNVYTWGPFTPYSQCSNTCGRGIQTKTKRCYDLLGSQVSSDKCVGSDASSRVCEVKKCMITWSDWSQWSSCPFSCSPPSGNKGSRVRIRCKVQALECTGENREVDVGICPVNAC
nr:uncharacterized protein LOC100178821 [Ciona intestinalis]|eukprot:XP_002124850.3 uncharacterized protein LOC100178821 [Ciona intestinalis]